MVLKMDEVGLFWLGRLRGDEWLNGVRWGKTPCTRKGMGGKGEVMVGLTGCYLWG